MKKKSDGWYFDEHDEDPRNSLFLSLTGSSGRTIYRAHIFKKKIKINDKMKAKIARMFSDLLDEI